MPIDDNNPFGEKVRELRRDGHSNEEIRDWLNDAYTVLQDRVVQSNKEVVDAVYINYDESADLDEFTYPIEDHETAEQVVEDMTGIIGDVQDWHETTLEL